MKAKSGYEMRKYRTILPFPCAGMTTKRGLNLFFGGQNLGKLVQNVYICIYNKNLIFVVNQLVVTCDFR